MHSTERAYGPTRCTVLRERMALRSSSASHEDDSHCLSFQRLTVPPYAMSGTDIASDGISRRAYYAVCGTDIAHNRISVCDVRYANSNANLALPVLFDSVCTGKALELAVLRPMPCAAVLYPAESTVFLVQSVLRRSEFALIQTPQGP
eukprot:3940799-Rhodomonas_salina.7